MSKFSDWIDLELTKRSWTRADLSRSAGISQAALSHIWKGDRNPGSSLCESIARAFSYPSETVFRAAGILPQVPERSALVERILEQLDRLPEDELDRIEAQVTALATRQSKIKPKTGPLNPRPK